MAPGWSPEKEAKAFKLKRIDFDRRSQALLLFLAVAWLHPRRITYLTTATIVSLLLAAAFDGSTSLILSPVPWLMLLGSVAAVSALRWATRDLAETLEVIEPSYQRPETFDAVIIELLHHFPSPTGSLLLGMAFAAALFSTGFTVYRPVSLLAFGLLSALSGTIFGFGLLGFVWSYRLIWRLRHEGVELFRAYRLRRLSSYACTLALIGIVPAILSWLISLNEGAPGFFLLLSMGLTALVFVVFLVSEMSIYHAVSEARFNRLTEVSDILERLHAQALDAADKEFARQREILDLIEKWECQRASMLGYRCNWIPWDAVCGKILLPVLVGTALVLVKIYMDVAGRST